MLDIIRSTRFCKDMSRMQKRGYEMNLLEELITRLQSNTLLVQDQDHPLRGDFKAYRSCHLKADWILLYRIHDASTIELYRTGTHSDIFKRKY